MTKARDAAEAAIFDALSSAGLTWPVYQHVPQDTPPPINIVGDMDGEGLGAKGDDDEAIELSILTVFQGEARKPVSQEQGRIKDALNEKTLTHSGYTIRPLWTDANAILMQDGETYLGTSRFLVFAFED